MLTTTKATPAEIRTTRRAFWEAARAIAFDIGKLRGREEVNDLEKLQEALRILRGVGVPPPGRGFLNPQIAATSEVIGAFRDLLEGITGVRVRRSATRSRPG